MHLIKAQDMFVDSVFKRKINEQILWQYNSNDIELKCYLFYNANRDTAYIQTETNKKTTIELCSDFCWNYIGKEDLDKADSMLLMYKDYNYLNYWDHASSTCSPIGRTVVLGIKNDVSIFKYSSIIRNSKCFKEFLYKNKMITENEYKENYIQYSWGEIGIWKVVHDKLEDCILIDFTIEDLFGKPNLKKLSIENKL